MSRFYQRENLASLEDKIRSLFIAASQAPDELVTLTEALNNDRVSFLREKKMGRVRLVNKWIDIASDKINEIKAAEFESLPVLGIF